MDIFVSYLLIKSLGPSDNLLVKGERESKRRNQGKLEGNSEEPNLHKCTDCHAIP